MLTRLRQVAQSAIDPIGLQLAPAAACHVGRSAGRRFQLGQRRLAGARRMHPTPAHCGLCRDPENARCGHQRRDASPVGLVAGTRHQLFGCRGRHPAACSLRSRAAGPHDVANPVANAESGPETLTRDRSINMKASLQLAKRRLYAVRSIGLCRLQRCDRRRQSPF
jgi:hypothetical protein